MGHKQSLISQLSSHINGLSLIASTASFSTRLMVANGIVISKLSYLIQLWGGCEDYLIRALQVVQTRSAKLVCKEPWYTPTRTLLSRCNWLSVRQLVSYQTAVMTHKIRQTGAPTYLGNIINAEFPYMTRQATTGGVRYSQDHQSRRALNHSSFRYRATVEYNRLPGTIREAATMQTFKRKLRSWIKENVPLT